ncbi:MAG: hypothetical protein GF364_11005 [Candidatus Lokiarchaeota archaeon]|nr:hypothetical protein [Candidatus Lokiarchaeota archaeon]
MSKNNIKNSVKFDPIQLSDLTDLKNPFSSNVYVDKDLTDLIPALIEFYQGDIDHDDLYEFYPDLEVDYINSSKLFTWLGGKTIAYGVKEALIDFFKGGSGDNGGCGWFIQQITIDGVDVIVLTDLDMLFVSHDYDSISEVCIVA